MVAGRLRPSGGAEKQRLRPLIMGKEVLMVLRLNRRGLNIVFRIGAAQE
jgi:hypothetical protein